MSYTSGSHTVFHHRYHIVWITKYRCKVLEGALRERIRTIIRQVCKELGAETVSGVLSRECVHMFVEIPPHIASAASCGASRDGHHTGCRWSSRTCATADLAHRRNRFIAALADDVVFGFVAPGGSLARLQDEVRHWDAKTHQLHGEG